MGVDLIDCVKAQWPEHAEHAVLLLPTLGQRNTGVITENPWCCSCGATGTLTHEQVGELLRANKVVPF